tara:strand:- start:176 stop:1525 length:1350 start_codon:yes stop_codon:yes gene_type:complete
MAFTGNEAGQLRVKQLLRSSDHWSACASAKKRAAKERAIVCYRERERMRKSSAFGRSMHEGARLAAEARREEMINALNPVQRRMKEVQRVAYLSHAALRERAGAEVRDARNMDHAWNRATRELRSNVAVIEELNAGGAVRVAGLPPPRAHTKKTPAVISVPRGSRGSYSNLIGRKAEPTTLAEDKLITSGEAAGWSIKLLQHASGPKLGQTYSVFVSPDGAHRFLTRGEVEMHLELELKAEMARRARGGRKPILPRHETGATGGPGVLLGAMSAKEWNKKEKLERSARRKRSERRDRSAQRSRGKAGGDTFRGPSRSGRRADVARLMGRSSGGSPAARSSAPRVPRGAKLIKSILNAREERSAKLAELRAAQQLAAEDPTTGDAVKEHVDARSNVEVIASTQPAGGDSGYAPARNARVRRAGAGKPFAGRGKSEVLPILAMNISRTRGI